MSPPKPHKVRKGVELTSDNLDWLYREYGDEVSISWFLNLLFTKARQIHEDTGVTPARVAVDAAKEAREEIIEQEN